MKEMETLLNTLITKSFEQHLQEGVVLKSLGGSWVKPGFEFNDDLIGLYLKDKGFQIMAHCLPEWRTIKKKSHQKMRIVLSA